MPNRIKREVASRVLEKAVEERLRRFVFPPIFEIRSAEDEVGAKEEAERLRKLQAVSDGKVVAVLVYSGEYHPHQDEQEGTEGGEG